MNSFLSYAQNFEDVILWRALKETKDGFYIDVGANSPLHDSVTRAFYERGWHGINIEADRDCFDELKEHRPRDTNLQAFASNEPGVIPFFHICNETGLSTFDPRIAAGHRAAGYELEERTVPMVTLNHIIELHAPPVIHFLKIDVEGAEKLVLQGIDLSRFRPWVIVVESTLPNSQTPSHDSFEPLLTGAGYQFCYFDGLNRFYVCDEQFEQLAPQIAVPPNAFDGIVRQAEHNLREHYESAVRQIQEHERCAKEMAAERDWLRATSTAATRERDQALQELARIKAEPQKIPEDEADGQMEAMSQLQAEVNTFKAFAYQFKLLCGKHLTQQARADLSRKTQACHKEIREAATKAYASHFGKKRLQLKDPEPRLSFFKRLFRSLFRKQGSVNKAVIGSLRGQIAWNENMETRLGELERLYAGAHRLLAQLLGQPIEPGGSSKEAAVMPQRPKELEHLSAPAMAVYESLQRARIQ